MLAHSRVHKKVYNRATGFTRHLPVGAGKVFFRSKESEIHVPELVTGHRCTRRFHPVRAPVAQGFIIVQQLDVGGGEVAFFQNFLEFFSF